MCLVYRFERRKFNGYSNSNGWKGFISGYRLPSIIENYSLKRQSILEEVSEEIEFVLVLHDAWHPSAYPKVEKKNEVLRVAVASRVCFIRRGNHWTNRTT